MNAREEIAQAARAAGWRVRYPSRMLGGLPYLEMARGRTELAVYFDRRIERVVFAFRDGGEFQGGKRVVLKVINETPSS